MATAPAPALEITIRERYDQAQSELRAAEHRLKELRDGHHQMAADLENLRNSRLMHVLHGDHRALDVDDNGIKRVEREAERQGLLIAEAEAEVLAVERRVTPLGDEVRRETHDRELTTARSEVIDQAARFVAAFKAASRELALYMVKRPQLVAQFGEMEGHRLANDAEALLDEIKVGLVNRGWKLSGPPRQFNLTALLPGDAEVPSVPAASLGLSSTPSAQLISHRPPIAATSMRV